MSSLILPEGFKKNLSSKKEQKKEDKAKVLH